MFTKRSLIAVCSLLLLATAVSAQDSDSRFPLNRSPNQKQADYLRSQNRGSSFPPSYRDRDTNNYRYGLPWRHRYGYPPYRYPYYYDYGPAYPYYGPVYTLPPVIRPWPVTPYPFRLP